MRKCLNIGKNIAKTDYRLISSLKHSALFWNKTCFLEVATM